MANPVPIGYGEEISADAPIALVRGEQRMVVPAREAQRWLNSQGWELESKERTQFENKLESADSLAQQALTAAEGTAEGLTFGLSTAALSNALGDEYREDAQFRKLANPNIAMGSTLLGAVAPAVLSGGASTAGTGAGMLARGGRALAFTPAGQVARIAARAGRGAESMLARNGAGLVQRVAAKAMGAGVEGAVEGAVAQAGQNLSEASLGDEELTAERLLANVPQAGLFGAGFGALFGAGVALPGEAARSVMARAAARKGERAIAELGERVDSLSDALEKGPRGTSEHIDPVAANWTDKALDYGAEMSARLSGKNVDDIKLGLKSKSARRDAFMYSDLLDESVEKAARATEGLLEVDPISRAIAKGELKSKNVAAAVKRGDDVKARIRQDVDTLRRDALDWAQTGEARYDLGSYSKRIRQSVTQAGKRLKAAEASSNMEADSFIALEGLKRDMDVLTMDARRIEGRASNQKDLETARRAREFAENVANRVRSDLEDATKWGTAGSNQAAQNAAISEFMQTYGAFNRRFVKRAGEQLGEGASEFEHWSDQLKIADRGSIRSHLNNLLDPDTAFERQQVIRHLEARAKAAQEFERIGVIPDELKGHFEKARQSSEDFLALLRDQEDRLRNAQAIRRLQGEEIGSGLLNSAGQNSAALVGSILGGGIGAVTGAAFDALRNPYSVVNKMAGIERLAQRLDQGDGRIRSSLRSALGKTKSAARATRRGITVSAALTMPALERRERAEKMVSQLRSYQENPELLTQHVTSNVTRGMGASAPNVVARIAAKQKALLDRLIEQIPDTAAKANPLQPHLTQHRAMTDDESRRLMLYAAGALNPASLLDDIRSVQIAPESVRGARENWPAYFEHMRSIAVEELASTSEELSFSKRVQLSLLFGLPGDPALDPGFLQRQQSRYSTRAGENEERPLPPSQTSAPETAAQAQTVSQQISERL